MSKRTLLAFVFSFAFAFAFAFVVGCGGGDDVVDIPSDDSGTDASSSHDAAKLDGTSGDALPDAPADGGADTSMTDSATDARVDSTADAPNDAPADVAVDAGPTSQQIKAVRDAVDAMPDGGVGATLPITGALVTYVKTLVGTDVAGFFVQADQTGPALFVAVDPATLTPVPVAGDRVSFNVNAYAKVAGMRYATGIDNFTRTSQGNSLTAIVQDVSNANDLVTNVDGYESELVKIMGATISGTFASAGTGFTGATLDTTAITGNALLKFRVPTTVHDALDLATGCTVNVTETPLWRNNTTSEPSGWASADVTVLTCPAPKVVSATALSATTVQVTFDRLVANVTSNGSQFTFDNGLVASAATASGKTVTVTTGAQAIGTTYTVTVATSVKDTLGTALNAAANTATFNGYQVVAQLLINEVNPNLPGGTDLIELRALTAGSIANIKLQQDVASPTTLVTLPNITVAIGDLIVVHLTPATNNVTSETTTKADCVALACYAGAWDVAGGTTGITFSNRVLRLLAPDGTTVQDAVPFAKAGTNSPSGYPADVQALQAATLWLPATCGGQPCTYTSTPLVSDATISVDWNNTVATVAGVSVQRHVATDNNVAGDWQQVASSWGAANP